MKPAICGVCHQPVMDRAFFVYGSKLPYHEQCAPQAATGKNFRETVTMDDKPGEARKIVERDLLG